MSQCIRSNILAHIVKIPQEMVLKGARRHGTLLALLGKWLHFGTSLTIEAGELFSSFFSFEEKINHLGKGKQ